MERSNIQTLRRNKQGIRKNPLKSADFRGFLVRVARLERAASTSQMSRATNCTTPGYLVVMIIARNSCDSKSFPVCGHLCGQSCFLARFPGQAKSRKRLCFKDFRVSAVLVMDEKAYAPKAGALPTALHPVISLFYPAGRILPKQARYQLRYTWILLILE